MMTSTHELLDLAITASREGDHERVLSCLYLLRGALAEESLRCAVCGWEVEPILPAVIQVVSMDLTRRAENRITAYAHARCLPSWLATAGLTPGQNCFEVSTAATFRSPSAGRARA